QAEPLDLMEHDLPVRGPDAVRHEVAGLEAEPVDAGEPDDIAGRVDDLRSRGRPEPVAGRGSRLLRGGEQDGGGQQEWRRGTHQTSFHDSLRSEGAGPLARREVATRL